jgi:hypothetical protein
MDVPERFDPDDLALRQLGARLPNSTLWIRSLADLEQVPVFQHIEPAWVHRLAPRPAGQGRIFDGKVVVGNQHIQLLSNHYRGSDYRATTKLGRGQLFRACALALLPAGKYRVGKAKRTQRPRPTVAVGTTLRAFAHPTRRSRTPPTPSSPQRARPSPASRCAAGCDPVRLSRSSTRAPLMHRAGRPPRGS